MAAGLKADDLILKANGKPVVGLADFYRKVWAAGSAGIDVTLSILEGAESKEVAVHSGDRNAFLMMKPKKTL